MFRSYPESDIDVALESSIKDNIIQSIGNNLSIFKSIGASETNLLFSLCGWKHSKTYLECISCFRKLNLHALKSINQQ